MTNEPGASFMLIDSTMQGQPLKTKKDLSVSTPQPLINRNHPLGIQTEIVDCGTNVCLVCFLVYGILPGYFQGNRNTLPIWAPPQFPEFR